MTRIAAHVDVAVPAELCLAAVQQSLVDDRWRAAYRALRPGREYSGWVKVLVPGRRLELTVAALDPVSGKRSHALGYRVTYDFTPTAEGRTRVEVGVEYGFLAALGGLGLLKPQAQNELLFRLMAMLALETGLRASDAAGATDAASGPAAAALPPPAAAELPLRDRVRE
jgi:hypothetical protein